MPHIFISYSRKDLAQASALENALLAEGLQVWRDLNSILPAESFPEATGKAIADCDILVLMWSPHARESRFVGLEWNTALALHKRIVPILLDSDCGLPPALAPFNGLPGAELARAAERIAQLLQVQGVDLPAPTSIPTRRRWIRRAIIPGIVLLMGGMLFTAWPSPQWKAHWQADSLAGKPWEIWVLCDSICLDTPSKPPKPPWQTISGQVVAETQRGQTIPIRGATISLQFKSNCAEQRDGFLNMGTDSLGRFMGKLCVDEKEEVSLRAQAAGYKSKTSIFPKSKYIRNTTIVLNQ